MTYQDAEPPLEPALQFDPPQFALDITQPLFEVEPDSPRVPHSANLISQDGTGAFDSSPATQPSSPESEQRFSFNFNGVPWSWVLKKFSEEAGLSLQMNAAPEGQFTYLDRKRYTLVDALDIFNDYLLAEGFIAIRNGGTLTVLNAQSEIPEGLIPLVSLDEVAELGRNELACVAIPVHNGVPSAVAQELEAILSPLGKAKPLSSSHRVLGRVQKPA